MVKKKDRSVHKIAIIQPLIPNYREDFFNGLSEHIKYDLYTLQDNNTKQRQGLREGNVRAISVKLYKFKKLKWYNPTKILFYETIVLSGEFSLVTNWIILILSKLLHRNVLVWGHGVAYHKNRPVGFLHFLMYFLSNGGIFYTAKEKRFWKIKFPKKKMVALNNTVEVDLSYYKYLLDKETKEKVRTKYDINQPQIFISCHRFTNPERRYDLLEKVIADSNPEEVAFIIIGEGYLKPDFSSYSNVFDYNSVWDVNLKSELFFISDYYLQLGWTGLSIVEAMAFGKPIVTLRRDKYVKQSVEYYYLKNKYNSLILRNIDAFHEILELTHESYTELSKNASNFYVNELSLKSMICNMASILENDQITL